MESDERIIERLDTLAKEVARQQSFGRMFVVGIIYGVGFFLGSAIIAVIALGIFGPWFADIPWIRDSFRSGVELLRSQ